jgi:hypothetical protein
MLELFKELKYQHDKKKYFTISKRDIRDFAIFAYFFLSELRKILFQFAFYFTFRFIENVTPSKVEKPETTKMSKVKSKILNKPKDFTQLEIPHIFPLFRASLP